MPLRTKFHFSAINDQVPRSISTGTVLVWVQCKEYRCLAYQHANGKWVNFYTGKARPATSK